MLALLRRCALFCVCTLIGLSASVDADDVAAGADDQTITQPVILFNGKDLDGWEGRDDLWSVEDGAIVGRTSEDDPIDGNTFLVWKDGQPSNFQLVLMFKIESGNSGIQYRSRVIDQDKFVVSGYQADIDFANKFAGILYEEKARGILTLRGTKVTIGADGKKTPETFADSQALAAGIHPGKWNEFRVVADGNHLIHYINGAKVSETIDQQSDKAAKSGVIALQLHRGPAMVVRFKNIKLLPLD
ncbi:3-keto-disaccharide hydrolase [Crateriforma conspicua]|uniref:3-keto-alpha-glucoside-1,2-lyase/3-keto-2-hydroxy-glucal hydratase domain-containing protein n=1 Tax=Crateriforma conspicua TaxID=2527996 RepID=A0A5C5XS66_9PLAN|nr:DUF1080 domain-containing protein [Crateriforma conspicua]QDV66113.1 hypothetical protein Mal65_52870 [Crateriforma conspicua]TWT65498.1 hypothetical protein Pan14r_50440 [Crateriforma conspicua]